MLESPETDHDRKRTSKFKSTSSAEPLSRSWSTQHFLFLLVTSLIRCTRVRHQREGYRVTRVFTSWWQRTKARVASTVAAVHGAP